MTSGGLSALLSTIRGIPVIRRLKTGQVHVMLPDGDDSVFKTPTEAYAYTLGWSQGKGVVCSPRSITLIGVTKEELTQ